MKKPICSLPKTFKFWVVLMAAGAFGLSATGCLLASGRPVLDFGETCSSDKDCASFGFCAAVDYETVCLPKSAECTQTNDPICAGYACELSYDVRYAYCERNCQSLSDCATGYSCTDYNSEGKGVCR
jgi:hypothetical protein